METTDENKIIPRPEQSGGKIHTSNVICETYREQIPQDKSGRPSRDRNDSEESLNEEDLDSTPVEETDTSEEDAEEEGYNYGSLDHEGNKDYSNSINQFLQ